MLEYRAVWRDAEVTVVGAEYLGIYPPWVRIIVADESEHEEHSFAVWESAGAARRAQSAAGGEAG